MKAVGSHLSDKIAQLISESFEQKSILLSDKSTSYANISDYVKTHTTEKSDKKTTKTNLKWAHIAIL